MGFIKGVCIVGRDVFEINRKIRVELLLGPNGTGLSVRRRV